MDAIKNCITEKSKSSEKEFLKNFTKNIQRGELIIMGRLDNKVVVITGATKGIGRAIATLFLQEGATVIGCARNKVENIEFDFQYLDVRDTKSCEKLFDYVIEKYKKVDCLISDAGIVCDSMTYKMTDEMFDCVIDTNLKGIFNVVRLFGPYMERQGFGSIINISSVVGEAGNIGQVNYAASKAGVIGMSKTWAKEFARKGAQVRVNAIAPGYVLTDMLKTVPQKLLDDFSAMTMLKRLGNPVEIAQVALFLASDDSSYITGTVVDVNGGLRL